MIGVLPFLPAGIRVNTVLPFIGDGQGTLAAAANSSVTLVDTLLQSSYVGAILGLGVTVRAVPEYEYTGNIIFRLLVNGMPFLDNNQGTWTTQRGSVTQLMPTFIQLPLGARVTFVATRSTVAAAVAQTIAFCSTGIQWPNTNPLPTDAARFRV